MKVCNSSATRRCRWNGVFVTFRRVEWTTSYPEAARSCTPVVPASHRRLYFQKLVDDRAADERDREIRIRSRLRSVGTPVARGRIGRRTCPRSTRSDGRRRGRHGEPAGWATTRAGRVRTQPKPLVRRRTDAYAAQHLRL